MKKSPIIILILLALLTTTGLLTLTLTGNAINNQPIPVAPSNSIQILPPTSQPNVSCQTPPINIEQSITICPGVYNQHIRINASNIKLTCQEGAIFDGSTSPGHSGIEIVRAYKNITIIGCEARNFVGSGLFLRGANNGSIVQDIQIINGTFTNNNQNGIFILQNTKNIEITGATITNNNENGIHIIGIYRDPSKTLFYPHVYKKLFPNNIKILGSTITNNNQNGIFINGEYYLKNATAIEKEENYILIGGNRISRNQENGIKNTDFFIERTNITGVGQYQSPAERVDGSYYVIHNEISRNQENGILVNTKRTHTNTSRYHCGVIRSLESASGIELVYSNNINHNKKNGISIESEGYSEITPPCSTGTLIESETWIDNIYRNQIINNTESGIYYNKKNALLPNRTSYLTTLGRYDYYLQNIIQQNHQHGIHSNTTSISQLQYNVSLPSQTIIECNDIIQNNKSGIQYDNQYQMQLYESGIQSTIKGENIIAYNKESGINSQTISQETSRIIYISESNITENQDIQINRNESASQQNYGAGYIELNNIDGEILAYQHPNQPSQYGIIWSRNWWGNYSQQCLNQFPADNWCDIPYTIPLSAQDIQAKAGNPWDRRKEYLQRAQTGTLPPINNTTCNNIEVPNMPPIPPIPPLHTNNTNNNTNTNQSRIGQEQKPNTKETEGFFAKLFK